MKYFLTSGVNQAIVILIGMTQILSKIIIFTITMFSCSLQSNEVHLTEGQEAPNFTLKDQEGNEHTLSSVSYTHLTLPTI